MHDITLVIHLLFARMNLALLTNFLTPGWDVYTVYVSFSTKCLMAPRKVMYYPDIADSDP